MCAQSSAPGQDNLKLVTLAPEYREMFLEMIADFQSAGETRYDVVKEKVLADFPAYLERLDKNARGEDLPEDFSPDIVYFLLEDERTFLGSVRLRLKLVPFLAVEGGHIGYDIRPSQRGKGYATRMLALCLQKARECGFDRVLVTCDQANRASARVIEKNGGVLENTAVSPRTGKPILRYWIQIKA